MHVSASKYNILIKDDVILFKLRGKQVLVNKHAFDGMNAENPHIKIEHLEETLQNPDRVDGEQYIKWIGNRTIIAYVTEYSDYIEVHGVSATRRRI